MDMKNRILWKCIIVLLCIVSIGLLLVSVWKNGAKKQTMVYGEEVLRENEAAYYEEKSSPQEQEETEEVPQESQMAMQEENIRVLLMDSGYQSYYQEEAVLLPLTDYIVNQDPSIRLAAGEEIRLDSASSYFQDGHILLEPAEGAGQITVLSIEREQGVPTYEGRIHLYVSEEGMWMVNELSLESYLKAVVPSEMPSSYEPEALKTQAVCARTYAVVQMQEKKLEDMGADVDDSVSYQVYQNQPATPEAEEAVESTRGLILCQDGQPVDAYYFSTSHGETSTDQVWDAAVPAAYLQNVACTYDEEEPWYRWEVTFSQEELLRAVQKQYPDLQTITDIEITERDEADTVIGMKVTDGERTYQAETENGVRSVLSPEGLTITRQDGSQTKGGSLLPSAYFTIERIQEDERVSYVIRGGGYGHGVGLSQNGAQNMAKEGKGYQEILQYFYKDVEIVPWKG